MKDAKGTIVDKTFPLSVKAPLKNISTISETEVVLGDTFTVTAAAKDGLGEYQYAFLMKADGETSWTTLSDFSQTDTVTITPDVIGRFTVQVKVKDAKGTVVNRSFTVQVNQPLENTSTVSKTVIIKGDSVQVAACALGGVGEVQFAILYKKAASQNYSVISDFGQAAEASIKPSLTGEYQIAVKAKDSRGTVETKVFTLTVNKPLKNTSALNATKLMIGNAVTVNAAAEGGIGAYSYYIRFRKDGETAYETLGEVYGEANTAAFTPAEAGSYEVLVTVMDSEGNTADKTLSFVVYPLLENLSSVSAQTVMLGDYVHVTAQAAGGNGDYTFTMKYKKTSGKYWTVIGTANSKETEGSFKPGSVTSYEVVVEAKDSFGNAETASFVVDTAAALKNTSTISVSNSVTLTAKAEGGIGAYSYTLKYKKTSETRWTVLGNTSTASFVPEAGIIYDVLITVADSADHVKSKRFTVCVMPDLQNLSTLSSASIAQGETVTIHTAASGGTGDYTYLIMVKSESGGKWTTLPAEETTFTPAASGTYTVRVLVMDETGDTAAADFTLTVT